MIACVYTKKKQLKLNTIPLQFQQQKADELDLCHKC